MFHLNVQCTPGISIVNEKQDMLWKNSLQLGTSESITCTDNCVQISKDGCDIQFHGGSLP